MATYMEKRDQTEDFQVPLMNVFRSAALEHDEKLAESSTGNEDQQISQRQIERREGISHDRLQKFFLEDLANLMSTVNLEAAQELGDMPHVQTSILNYGIEDVTSLYDHDGSYKSLAGRLKQSLIDHEPRLIPDSVVVEVITGQKGTTDQKPAFSVHAVMAARPVDVPLEFVAEVDAALGKISTSQLTVEE